MTAEKFEENTYEVEITEFNMNVKHLYSPGLKNSWFNRLLKKIAKPDSTTIFLFCLILVGYPMVSTALVLIFMNIPTFIMMISSFPYVFCMVGLANYVEEKTKQTTDIAQVSLSKLTKINKLMNKKEAIEKYFTNLSPQKQKMLFKNVKMFSELNDKNKEFDGLLDLMENDSVLRKDILQQKKALEESQAQIRKYLDDFEKNVVSDAADDTFLSTMTAFAQLMEEQKEMMIDEVSLAQREPMPLKSH